MRRFRERGEGQLGCVFALILLLVAIFVAYKMVPVKVKAAELRGEIIDEAKNAGVRNDATITKSILAKAQQLGTEVLDEEAFVALLSERGVDVPSP